MKTSRVDWRRHSHARRAVAAVQVVVLMVVIMGFAALSIDDRQRDSVEDYEPFAAVLHTRPRNYENGSGECGNLDLPLPAKVADFLISAARVDGEQRHVSKIAGQFHEESCLLVPAQRIRQALLSIR